MHKKVCIVQAKTLEQAKYFLKTKLGISSECAEHTQECPWFGTGQGSGNSPFYWLLISSTLYDLYCDQSTGGATYTTPDKTLQVKIHLLGFVDDVLNRTTLSPTIDSSLLVSRLDQLIQQATEDSQLWHDILTASNQELELTKCKHHFIHFQFKNTGQPIMVEDPDPNQPQCPLNVTGKNNQLVEITCVPSSRAIKYLGCHKCPANQHQQKAALLAKCQDCARVINCSHLSRRGTQVFYQAIYRLSINYPLPVCYFTFKELDNIQRKAHLGMVSHCGFNCHSKREVLFGPAHLGGATFFHLYDEQGYGQVSHFIKFWRTPNSFPGQVLRVTLAWAQYSVGTGTPILQDTTTALPHFESNWLASLRQYLQDVGGHLELDQPFVPALQRTQDQFIMDIVLQSKKFKPGEVRQVNYCRLYLRVLTLADISNANGTYILQEAFDGEDRAILKNSKWCHVHQKKPGVKAWYQWRKACRLISQWSTHQLDTPLGPWVIPAAEIRRPWEFWHHRGPDHLYRRRGDGTFTCHQRMLHNFDSDIASHTNALPAAAVPVDASIPTADAYRMEFHYNQWALPPPPPVPSQELTDYASSLDLWEKTLLEGLTLLVDQTELFQALQSTNFIIASDGSQQAHRASFGWILSNPDGHRLATCKGPCLGARPNSYRAEGYGLLSVCRFLHHLRTFFALALQSCLIVCDNKAMVERSGRTPKHLDDLSPNSTMESEWDILMEIWTTNSVIPTDQRPQFQHVKGHQDKKRPYAELPLLAQLNCDADQLANEFITQNPDLDYSRAHRLPSNGAQLHLPIGTISNKLSQELRLARTTKPLEDHLKAKFTWDDEAFSDIDWECSRRGYNRLRPHRTTLIKQANKMVPVGKLVHKYDPKYPENCPSCQEPVETSQHLHQCNSPSRVKLKREIIQRLRQTMSDMNTRIDLMELLLEGLQSIFDSRDSDTINIPNSVAEVAAAQDAIGWEHLLRGRLSKSWAIAQQSHTGAFQPKNNGQTWATKIIQELLQAWLDIWTLRNGDRHGRDKQTRTQAAKAQAIRELQQLYDLQGQVKPEHEWLFQTPLQARINMTTYSIRAFISNWKPVLVESYKERLATG
jgi:hypothetical protein